MSAFECTLKQHLVSYRIVFCTPKTCIIACHADHSLLILIISLLCYYRLFTMYYSFVLFLAYAFLLRSTTFSFSQSHGSAHYSSHHTASQQYSCLHCTTFAAFLLFTRSRTLRSRSLFCSFVCSSVWRHWTQPRSFSLHSVHSQHPLILHPLRSAALCDLVDTHNPDLFCLTETLIKPTTTSAVHLDNRHSSSVDCGGAPPPRTNGPELSILQHCCLDVWVWCWWLLLVNRQKCSSFIAWTKRQGTCGRWLRSVCWLDSYLLGWQQCRSDQQLTHSSLLLPLMDRQADMQKIGGRQRLRVLRLQPANNGDESMYMASEALMYSYLRICPNGVHHCIQSEPKSSTKFKSPCRCKRSR